MAKVEPRIPVKQSLRCRLSKDASVALVAYRGSEWHEPHRHNCGQLTIQLAGSFSEQLEGREYLAQGVMIGFKPERALHADQGDGAGSLLFTINAREEAAKFFFEGQSPGWRKSSNDMEIVRLIASLSGASIPAIEEALPDLVALCSPMEPLPPSKAALALAWLARIREALCDDPAGCLITILSAGEGIHRVHLARSFRRYFGMTPSEFRRNQMAARLANSLAEKDMTLAECALEEGFCDQSHASRVFRRETGLRLSQWRAMLV
jgi:AraC family transcriptional regulator